MPRPAGSPTAGSPVDPRQTPAPVTVDPSGKFAYVANDNTNNVSAYTIDATTGVLTSVGSPFDAGLTAPSVTVDPQRQVRLCGK